MNTVLVALIASTSGPLCGLIVVWVTGRQRRLERREQWARDDELRRRTVETNDKLDKIHGLVNGALTRQMQKELEGVKRELFMMKKLMDLNITAGNEPNAEDQASIEAMDLKIAEMSRELEERLEAQKTLGLKVEGRYPR
jgi:hypothetical protein